MDTRRWPVPLQPGLVYGPIASKRLGRSLGINLSGIKRKLCNYNCVYCFYGPTSHPPEPQEFPPVDDVIAAVTAALNSIPDVDWLTFSGNGESTLHPEFPRLVKEVRSVAGEVRPWLPVALLSNGSTAIDPSLRETLTMFDLPVLKLDAGDAETHAAVNRPVDKGVSFEPIVEGLRMAAGTGKLVIQSVMFDGKPSNSRGRPYHRWLETLNDIQPAALQLYTLDHPVGPVNPIDTGRLDRIARDVEGLGIKVKVYREVNT